MPAEYKMLQYLHQPRQERQSDREGNPVSQRPETECEGKGGQAISDEMFDPWGRPVWGR